MHHQHYSHCACFVTEASRLPAVVVTETCPHAARPCMHAATGAITYLADLSANERSILQK
jgi:hypothetical protein